MRPPRRARGIAILAIMGVLLLVGAAFALGSLNVAATRVERERATNDALRIAKDALIAYAVSDANRPGELPCPDFNGDGQITLADDYTGSNCRTLLGRLPWRTLGLPELRDDSGEPLWYALSDDFHANGTQALNSDTAYRAGHTSLSITGLQNGSNLVALVISPGSALTRAGAAALQQRTAASMNTASNYLDIDSGQDNADLLPAPNPVFIAAPSSTTFNDRLLPIYSDDIMALVERRAAGEVASVLRQHYDAWESLKATAGYTNFKGFYPWAVAITPATNPATSLPGTAGTRQGLVPSSGSQVVWTSANSALLACAGVGTTEITCTGFAFFSTLNLNISGRVGNIGSVATTPPSAANVSVAGGFLVGAASPAWTLQSAANALDFTYGASVFGLGVITIRVQAPPAIAMPAWLATNNWPERTHYAVSSAYSLTGTQSCAALPCLTVNGSVPPTNEKHAVIVMSGRALPLGLPAQTRPAAPPITLGEYLELENLTNTDGIFQRGARTATFNDQALVVRP